MLFAHNAGLPNGRTSAYNAFFAHTNVTHDPNCGDPETGAHKIQNAPKIYFSRSGAQVQEFMAWLLWSLWVLTDLSCGGGG